MTIPAFNSREALSDALRYWEPRRLLYNGVLALVVFSHFLIARLTPREAPLLTADTILVIFLLAVVANVAYCAAYLGDIPAQLSAYRSAWARWRPAVFWIGTAFASVLAHFLSRGLFLPSVI